MSFTLTQKRTHFPYRLGITAADKAALLMKIRNALDLDINSFIPVSAQAKQKSRLAWVFSGQGPQWWKMGRELLENSPLFRKVIVECDRLLTNHCDWSLYEELTHTETESRINETYIAQPALFAIQIGLAKLWQSLGVRPDVVVGHSVGEVAAAYVTGIYTLEEAIEVIYLRSLIQHKAHGLGSMLAVELSEQEVEAYIESFTDKVSIAAINGPTTLTLSGCTEVLKKLQDRFNADNIFNKSLKVAYAFHSQQMDFLQTEILDAFADIKGKKPRIPLWSTVTGEIVTECSYDGNYWWHNVRDTVKFAKSINSMITEGINLFSRNWTSPSSVRRH